MLEDNKDVEAVIQFGSSVKGKKPRDIDICIFTNKALPLKRKLSIISSLSQYDVSFANDLPIHVLHRVFSEGRILMVRNYEQLLMKMRMVEDQYPQYKRFLED